MRNQFALAVAVATLACATPAPRALPTFQQVPDRPEFASSEVARQAWAVYQSVAARQIAAKALPPGAFVDPPIAIDSAAEQGHLVRFCAPSDAGPVAVYDIEIPGGLNPRVSVSHHSPPVPLVGDDLSRFSAQAAWLSELSRVVVCPPAEAIALRNDRAGGWRAYLVPIPDQPGFLKLGGFHRLELDDTATMVVARSQDTRPCGGWNIDSTAVALAIAEPQPRTPDVGDVYTSLLWEIVLYFSNTKNDTIWAVDDGGVRDVTDLLRRDPQ